MRLFPRPARDLIWLSQPFDLHYYQVNARHFIPFTEIKLLSDFTWQFTWDETEAEFYRVVFRGRQIDGVTETTYIYTGPGDYSEFPPPLEIAYENELTPSEINSPFQIFQWYGDPVADYYELRFEGSAIYRISELSIQLYTYSTAYLPDLSETEFDLVAVNNIGQESDPRIFQVLTVTPPIVGAFDVSYDMDTLKIVIEEAE